jgi:hypothetical protein
MQLAWLTTIACYCYNLKHSHLVIMLDAIDKLVIMHLTLASKILYVITGGL